MSEVDLAEIAGKISKAQRAYLTTKAEWRSPDGYQAKRWMSHPPIATHRVLMALHLIDRCGQISTLGIAVRDYLLAQEEGR